MEKNLTIQQVADILQVEISTVRFWEKEFSEFLDTGARKGQHKRFTNLHIERLNQIKELLYTEMYTIKGAKRKLEIERSLAAGLGIETDYKTTVFLMFSAIMAELQNHREESSKLTEKVKELHNQKTRIEEMLNEEKSKGFIDFIKDKIHLKKVSSSEEA